MGKEVEIIHKRIYIRGKGWKQDMVAVNVCRSSKNGKKKTSAWEKVTCKDCLDKRRNDP